MSLSAAAPGQINAKGTPKTPIQDLAERSEFGEISVRRAIGAFIDFIVLFLFLLIPDAVLGNELYQKTIWLWLGALVLYFVLGEGLWGRSVGKLIMGTAVVDAAGQAPGLLKALARTVLRIVEVNPFLLCLPAVIAFAASTRRQRLGDMLARTYVVRAVDLKAVRNGLPPALPGQAATPAQTVAERANPVSLLVLRAIGAQIDILVILMLLIVPTALLGKEHLSDRVWDYINVFWLVALVAYFVVFEALWGRTLGKLITGTVVIDRNGRAPGFARALVRTLLRLIEVNPLLIGGLPAGIALLVTKRHQRMGDLLAGTYVVRKKYLRRDASAAETPVTPVVAGR
ncbi:MAG: RDD family protein [Xanthobacteraceae bacterium]